jgi:SM-20-related protein
MDESFDAPDSALRLRTQFPRDNFQRLTSWNEQKQYSFSGRRVTADSDGLTNEWREFIRSLEVRSYRLTLGSLLGIDLRDRNPEITVWRYQKGDFLSPHTDKIDKLVSHIFYFSEPDWSAAHGGCLEIFQGNNPTVAVQTLAPVCGRSVIIVRSDRSLHAVTKQKRAGYDRCAVQVVFQRQKPHYSHEMAPGGSRRRSNRVGTQATRRRT